MIVTIRWNAVSTEVRINVKCHRGINQCNKASDKIIEVRSNGRKVRSNGMKVRSNGMKERSNGMKVRSNGMKVRSNGMKVRSNGMQVAIRLHFCPECSSILILPRELPSIGWGCMHEEDAAMEYKCPYAVRGMLISEVWNKVEYLEMHEGKLELKRGHRYYTPLQGPWPWQAWKDCFCCLYR